VTHRCLCLSTETGTKSAHFVMRALQMRIGQLKKALTGRSLRICELK
jgi:hypothetical protein